MRFFFVECLKEELFGLTVDVEMTPGMYMRNKKNTISVQVLNLLILFIFVKV